MRWSLLTRLDLLNDLSNRRVLNLDGLGSVLGLLWLLGDLSHCDQLGLEFLLLHLPRDLLLRWLLSDYLPLRWLKPLIDRWFCELSLQQSLQVCQVLLH